MVDGTVAIVVESVVADERGVGFGGVGTAGAAGVGREVNESIGVVVDSVVADERDIGFGGVGGTGAAAVAGVVDGTVAIVVESVVADERGVGFGGVGSVATTGVRRKVDEPIAIVVEPIVAGRIDRDRDRVEHSRRVVDGQAEDVGARSVETRAAAGILRVTERNRPWAAVYGPLDDFGDAVQSQCSRVGAVDNRPDVAGRSA